MRPIRLALQILIATGLLSAPSSWGQTTTQTGGLQEGGSTRTAVGGFGSLQWNMHSDPGILPLASICDNASFAGEGGLGFTIGGHGQIPFSPLFGLQLRLGYSSLDGKVAARSFIGNVLDAADNLSIPANVEHTYEAGLGMIYLEPALRITPLSDFPLSLNLGVDIGYMLRNRYQYAEALNDPSHVRFFGESAPRTRTSGVQTIEGSQSLYSGALMGISADIPIGPSLIVSPEVSYVVGLTGIVSNTDWKVNSLRLGVAVKSVLSSAGPDTVTPPPLGPNSAIVKAVALDTSATEHPTAVIRVLEFRTTQMYPLVDAIFFNEGSDRIRNEYKQITADAASSFNIQEISQHSMTRESLSKDGVRDEIPPYYYHLLNIVGSRMRAHPSATITLVSYQTTHGSEKNDPTLPERRTKVIRDYLRDVWGIKADHIIEEKKSATDVPDADTRSRKARDEEQQRVDIISDVPEILDPVITSDIERVVTPPMLRLKMNGAARSGIARWTVQVMQGGVKLFEESGTGSPPATRDIDLRGKAITGDQISSLLRIYDNDGVEISSEQFQLPVEHVTEAGKHDPVVRRDRYRLLTFGFDQAVIDQRNQRNIAIVTDSVKSTSTIRVIGYADWVGDDAYNETLAEKRAAAVAGKLGTAQFSGIGEEKVYDWSLPEGRYYNRFVDVLVETPLP